MAELIDNMRREDVTLEEIQRLTKNQWISLAEEIDLEIKRWCKKDKLVMVVLEGLLEKGFFQVNEDVQDELCDWLEQLQENVIPERLTLKEKEELRMREEKEKAELRMKEEELKERIRLEEEKNNKELAIKEQEMVLKAELEREGHNVYSRGGNQLPRSTPLDFLKYLKLIPSFSEDRVEEFFINFEKVVSQHPEIEKDKWAQLVQSKFVGLAAKTYATLSDDHSKDFDVVKEKILQVYELTPEAYRRKFRSLNKKTAESYVDYVRELTLAFDRWAKSKKVSDYEGLRNLVLMEQFGSMLQPQLRTYLRDQNVDIAYDGAIKVDNYLMDHGDSSPRRNKRVSFDKYRSDSTDRFRGNARPNSYDKGDVRTSNSYDKGDVRNSRDESRKTLGNVKCHGCGRMGHVKAFCWKDKKCYTCDKVGHLSSHCTNRVKRDNAARSALLVDVRSFCENRPIDPVLKDGVELRKLKVSERVLQGEDSFTSLGVVSHVDGTDSRPIRIFRDTGANVSVMVAKKVPEKALLSNVGYVILGGLWKCEKVPLYEVYLQTDLIKGTVVVGVVDEIPKHGIELLLGNDLAGNAVCRPNAVMLDEALANNNTVELEKKFPKLFPANAVKCEKKDCFAFDVMETIPELVEEEEEKEAKDVKESPLGLCQKDDPTLQGIFKNVEEGGQLKKQGDAEYLIEGGVLMRKWMNRKGERNDEVRQIVVPEKQRDMVMRLAHESEMSGHVGINKTKERIMREFYWPKINEDVKKYCMTCELCQQVGKPRHEPSKVPLRPIGVEKFQPFDKIVVDFVGPLPITKSRHRHLLTVMCQRTRYPEVYPIRAANFKNAWAALTKFFCTYGYPKEMQTDRGTAFTSQKFGRKCKEYNIKLSHSSGYHPQSQGCLERFHQTLKTMMRTYCIQYESEWDESVPNLLFAIRDSINDSLGYTPFELVYGHQVRNPVQMLRENWLSNEKSESPLTNDLLVSKMQEQLETARGIALKNLENAQEKMKENYDRKTEERKFSVGDKVLVLANRAGKPLAMKYEGPWDVIQVLPNDNYEIKVFGKRNETIKCHINRLKAYVEKAETREVFVGFNDVVEEDFCKDVGVDCKLSNSVILENIEEWKLKHLDENQKKEVLKILHHNTVLFGNVPNVTNKMEHHVILNDSKPIRQAPYRMNPEKKEYLKQEISYMLENNIIRESKSPWASPTILVAKPKGYRVCIDYRKVNAVTIPDSYPLPRIEDIIDKVGHATFITTLDLMKGYYGIALAEEAKEISAFVTPFGLYEFNVLAFGFRNAPATFQRMVNDVVRGIEGIEVYIDDIVIFTDTWKDHVLKLKLLFDRLREANLTVNLEKSVFVKTEVTYLGHKVGNGKIAPNSVKVVGILDYPTPSTRKQVRRFLGMSGFYRRFCKNFSEIVSPLTDLLCKGNEKDKKMKWTDKCEESFIEVKKMLSNEPVLMAPDFCKDFVLQIDASDIGFGGVLLQNDRQDVLRPICYFSKKLLMYQKKYSTIEKEALALIKALEHFEVYLNTGKRIAVYSDHNPLVFVLNNQNSNHRLLRWSLFLQSYDLEINYVKGRENVIADCLSRM